MKTEFLAGNSEGSILRIVEEAKQMHFFRDPWGRDSSSTPDEIFPIDTKLPENKAFQEVLTLYPKEEQQVILEWCK
jgi:hypothetical protein